MFYEDERIRRKNRMHLQQKANEMIEAFKSKGFKPDEIVAAIEMFLAIETNSEFKVDVAKQAIATLNSKDESGKTNT